jgi:ABC-2 type transport system ATP-binding protein
MTDGIVTDGLTKYYGDLLAVDGVDLDVEGESIYGFLGPNGAGKTTTIKLLTGLLEPDEGSATVAGVDVGDREALVERIGYAPETPPLYPNLTGRENLNCVAEVRGVADAEPRIDRLLDRFDLREDEGRRVTDYSKGMTQKVNLAQAVLHEPDVAFLDEPTSGLDPQSAADVRELFVELADGGTTVFLSTHILPVVEDVADRVGILHDGEVIREGAVGDVVGDADETDLEDVFLELTERPEGVA